ncbi:2-(R)-hydroxypropyl-CoM dehydrogenase [Paraliobacillus sp. PM-2]|uniref:SDR family NAD(P)-dependent oxidoreductase n=1 Tax=Paraliobacillus sp. PM-2 TaxID=1462524 RepID=UPI00061C276D|nr:glucose 1-dehydrogenase [Paraliobacillus sp. PM-2]CQR48151.1 2-(R)-hydroxypropyl-CoM dehydrogenase [Paraliobacillus sp. PM-2]
MRLEEKVAIITGSGNGIGKAIATRFAHEGAKVVIADFDEDALTKTVEELKEVHENVIGFNVNVVNEEDVNKMIDRTIEKFGRVDILVNNAGVLDNMQAAPNVEDKVWNRVMDINVGGVMRTMRKVIPAFVKQGGGTIVNMASITALTGGRGGLTYTAAKHAVAGMTKNVASHYGKQGIRANAIAPSQVKTGLTHSMDHLDKEGMELAIRGTNLMGEPLSVEDISNITVFLASDESSAINGVVLATDNGWSAY